MVRKVLLLTCVGLLLGCASHRAQLGHEGSSLSELALAVKLAPSDVDARVRLGAALARAGQYRLALAQFDSALSLMPNYPWALYEKGQTLRVLGFAEEGKRLIRRAADSPQGAEVLARLGRELGRPFHIEQLTSGRYDHAFPSWFPDGRRIALQTNRTGNWELFVFDLASRSLTQLTDHPARDEAPCVSPDGRLLAFTSTRDSEPARDPRHQQREIYLLDVPSTQVRQLTRTHADDFHPVFSPNGARLFYVSAPPDDSGTRSVMFMSLDDPTPKPLTQPGEDCFAPAVSADGAFLLFVKEHQGRSLLCEMDLRTKRVRVVTDTLGVKAAPSFSPDGATIAFAAKDGGKYDLYLIGRDGSNLQQLTNDQAIDGHPHFSPDGKRLVFHSNRTGTFQLYLVELTRPPSVEELQDFFE
ncbi:MAG: PD40 domain-containing protein [Calditrichaeota bacterium]|nr:PD40 domain-containing protein [Calditrichota bacterium]